MNVRLARVICFIACCAALAGVATLLGWPQALYAADATNITLGIAGMALVAPFIGASWRRWLGDQGVTLLFGLMGTMIGFWLALEGAIQGADELKMAGLGAALSTTIAGLVAHFYTLLLSRIGDESP